MGKVEYLRKNGRYNGSLGSAEGAPRNMFEILGFRKPGSSHLLQETLTAGRQAFDAKVSLTKKKYLVEKSEALLELKILAILSFPFLHFRNMTMDQ